MIEQKSLLTLKDEVFIEPERLKDFMSKFLYQFGYSACKQWEKNSIGEICEGITEWRVQRIQAYANDEQLILKQVENIRLRFLMNLNMWGNNIFSIEGICRVEMPMLKKLWLWRNNIARFDSLRKAHLPMLNYLDIKENPMNGQGCLTELKTQLKLDRLHTDDSVHFCFEIIKMEANKISENELKCVSRIKISKIGQPSFSNQLLKKYNLRM